MNEHEYLNEERYQKTKKKISIISLIVLIIGVGLGSFLIYTGYTKTKAVKEENTSETVSASEVEAEIDKLNEELIPLKAKENAEFQANGFSEEYYRLENEVNKLQRKVSELNSELSKIKSGYNDTKNRITSSRYIGFYMIGGMVIFMSCILAGGIYMTTKQREMLAFTTQQAMPVGKEFIEEMTPTVAKSTGEIAKEISKNIKR